jgi:hypothetical protein
MVLGLALRKPEGFVEAPVGNDKHGPVERGAHILATRLARANRQDLNQALTLACHATP